MGLPELHNFSVAAGDNAILEFDIATGTVNLTGAAIAWDLYEAVEGMPVSTTPILSKELDYGIEATNDGETTEFSVELEQDDTLNLRGNFYYEAKMVSGDGKNISLAFGLVTVTGLYAGLTSRTLRLRFPEFADNADADLEFVVAAAIAIVGDDDGWIEGDIPTARLYLAAHLVQAGTLAAETEGGAIVSETIGRISTTYAASSSSDRVQSLQSTSYGQRFLELQRGSHGGPLVV